MLQFDKVKLRRRFKIFSYILIIFLISKLLILSTVLFTRIGPIPNDIVLKNAECFRWFGKETEILIHSGDFESLQLILSSPVEQNVKVINNDKVIKQIQLQEGSNIYSIKGKFLETNGKVNIKFISEKGFIPSLVDKNSTDKRELSFMVYDIKTNKIFNRNLLAEIEGLKNVYGIETWRKNYKIKDVLLEGLMHFDASWYTYIIDKGYVFNGDLNKQQNVGFPYIYPFTAKSIKNATGINPFWAGALLNNLMHFIFLILIYYFSNLIMKDKGLSFIPVILLCLHPFSVFLVSAFSEGMFIFFISLSLYFLYKRKLKLAALTVGVVSGIRTIGMAIPFLLWIYYFFIEKNKITMKNIGKLSLLSIISYWSVITQILYYQVKFNEPLLLYKINFNAWSNAWNTKASLLNIVPFLRNPILNFYKITLPEILGMNIAIMMAIACIIYIFKYYRTMNRVELILISYSTIYVFGTLFITGINNSNQNMMGRYTLGMFPLIILLTNKLLYNKGYTYLNLIIMILSFNVFELIIMTMRFSYGLPPM